MSHTPPTPLTTLISNTSPALDKTTEPRVPPIYALTATIPPPDPTSALPSPSHSLSTHTCITVTATTALTTYGTTTTPQTDQGLQQDYKHHTDTSVKVKEIKLQVNDNGIKNNLEELKLLIHDTHADIITIQETKLTPKPKHPKYITLQQCAPIGCTRQEVDSSHSLETT